VEEVGIVGEKEQGKNKVRRRKEREKKKRRTKIGGEKGKWSKRGLSKLKFGQNGRGR
jgi:hypothetical protein